jgi:O-glycosyl hydrolase
MNGKLKKTLVAMLVTGGFGCSGDTKGTGQGSGHAGGTANGGAPVSGSGGSENGSGGSGEGGAQAGGGNAGGIVSSGGTNAGAGQNVNGGQTVSGGSNAAGAGRGGSPSGGRDGVSGGAGGSKSSGGSAGMAMSGAGSGGARPTVTAAPGTTLVKVNPTARHQTFEGWGTSLCWWANHAGGWSASARNALVDAVVNPTTGLGYNVFRYNIGGGENPAHDHMGQDREMPGFEPTKGTWTWDADANQRAILERIVESGTGVILEAFSNSPPYWMTKSGCASGSSDGSNNLKDDSYEAFAEYLTEVVKHYRDAFGIPFRTLEPLNEPNANWWKANGSQEGCHFSPSNQETLIKAVAAKLSEKGLTETRVSTSDENSMDDAYNNLRAFSATTLAAVSQLNTHSYAGSRRKELRALATSKAKRLWQSESGPLNQTLADDADAALFMAGRIITDLRDLQPEAWIDWQVGDPARAWATFTLNDAQQKFTPLKRFYMHAGFSRYIRPGAVFVDIDNADMVAALSQDGHSLAVVMRNGDTSTTKSFTFDLSALSAVGATAEARRTSRTENLAELPSIAIQNYSLQVSAPPYSVTTLVVPVP